MTWINLLFADAVAELVAAVVVAEVYLVAYQMDPGHVEFVALHVAERKYKRFNYITGVR